MIAVFTGSFDMCLEFIREEKLKDDTLEFDLVQSDISDTLFYVKELDGYDMSDLSF
jgi:hypothetical protein